MVDIIMIGAGNRGYFAYGEALKTVEESRVVAIAEPDKLRRERFAERHGIRTEDSVADWKVLLSRPKFADGVIVATPETVHVEPTIEALARGYSVLLEKPISVGLSGVAALTESGVDISRLFVAHVLRYSSFFKQLKSLLDSDSVGRIQAVEYTEQVSFYHFAHSYVRGNWRDSTQTGPSILSKSCHDMDILTWLLSSRALSVASRGGLKYFKRDNAPKNSTERCLDCPLKENCPYSAVTQYLSDNIDWPVNTIGNDMSLEGRREILRTSSYGRCVFRSDNNVADYQNVLISFDNAVEACFSMNAFTTSKTRKIRISGSHGEITGDFEKDSLEVELFSGDHKAYLTTNDGSRHGGGDREIVRDFVRYLQGKTGSLSTTFENSIQSHLMCWAAEKSRLTGGMPVDPWSLVDL
ncbi:MULTISPECIES: Gfo/Idh/MocA family protein [unclassified Mesotoga]|uniref:Gfo/Idh/MocA family protein n=1 Tax=unclassified Mesotoga TaxID=1184398 RepID=UPI000EF185FD|nr:MULTISPECIES: Gfo/Idh/MocA family oxidoreductase [unclassified Mesotoga]MDD3682117.1 Gfo/Idh/MocA family oxidoreductase [Mesotoga sp.]MDD4207879.1 Gfo/Idh/MocA family oxidoreductase [Mesotoga sp.]NLT44096.1 Gfo/Idh/MocA family oxidoreductase [Thermotogaceae bacterium]RLL85572.1 oxidoreductase [Mesotoga sp. BH458_6_3_2_1]